jgi:hypothetical protein
MANPHLDPPDLPFDEDDRNRGITARQALINLLHHEESLSDETWNFVHSCAKFPRLSPKQEQALVSTWYQVELEMAFRVAQRNRRRRRKSDEGRTDDDFLRAKRTEPLTKNEMHVLGLILTVKEFQAVLMTQSDKQRAAVGRQLMRAEQLN